MALKQLLLFMKISLGLCLVPSKQPHIIFIMSDDMGWNDFGFHGQNQIPTPNVDALAYNGVVLNRFYTQQACTPSRAALLTGNYPLRAGMQGVPIDAGEDRPLPRNITLMPEHLRRLGYKTHMIGKWHLNAARKSDTPTEKGFDSFFGYWNGWVGYFDYKILTPLIACNITAGLPPSIGTKPTVPCLNGFDLHDGVRPAWEYQGQYATTLFTNKAVDIIKKHDKNRPLFLYLSHLAGHSGKDAVGLEVPSIPKNDKEFHYIKDEGRRRYAGIVKEFDISVGKVMRALDENHLLQNSIIVVLSDNGAQTTGVYANKGSGWPFRGLKFTGFEGGVRGSAVVYSPLLKLKGHINNELMHISDFLPTFYSAAGGKVSELGIVDGVDQWKTIKEGIPTTRNDLLINVNDIDRWSAIIGQKGRYKLMNGTFDKGVYDKFYGESGRGPENPSYNLKNILLSDASKMIIKNDFNPWRTLEKGIWMRKELDYSNKCDEITRMKSNNDVCYGFCLYDLFEDPCETTNVAAKHPTILEALKARMTEYWSQLVPQREKVLDAASNPVNCNGTWFLWKENPPFCPTAKI